MSLPLITLTFINKHRNPVNLYWVNGKENHHATLNVGERYEQGSQPDLLWVARDQGTGRILTRARAKADTTIEIIPRNRRLAVRRGRLAGIDSTHRAPAPTQNFALEFDGDNDVVVVPHANSLNLKAAWTLEAWVYRQKQSIEQIILEKYDGEGGGFSLRIGANNLLQGGAFDDSKFVYGEGETRLRARRWYHIAVSYDSTTKQIICYVNGVPETTSIKIYDPQDSSQINPPASLPKKGHDAPLKIGKGEPDHFQSFFNRRQAGNHFAGRLDSIRIWNIARPSADIAKSWKQILNPEAESNLVAYYRLDEPLVLGGEESVTTDALEKIKDSTNKNNHGRFGSANRLKNVRIWSVARSYDAASIAQDELTDANELLVNWPLAADSSLPDFAGTDSINLDRDFTVETSIDLGSFNLASDYQPLLFKRDSWSLDLLKVDNKPYIRFSYHYRDKDNDIWKKIDSKVDFNKPLSNSWEGWVHVAVVGKRDNPDTTSAESNALSLYINGTKYTSADTKAPEPFKINRQQIRIGGEGKPKWVASDLTLLNGVVFDGSDDYINLGNHPYFDQKTFTLEAWVKILEGTTNDFIFCKSNTSNSRRDYGLVLVGSSNKIRFQYTHNGKNVNLDWHEVNLADEAWHHLALVIEGDDNGGKVTLCIDGIGREPETLKGPMTITPDTDLWLGMRQPSTAPLKGIIDEVRFWRVARTAPQIQGYLQRQVPPAHKDLAGLWTFGEGSGAVAYDSTRYGNHGLLGDGNSSKMPTWMIPSAQTDRGLEFNGADDYLDLGADPSFDLQAPFTLEARVKPLTGTKNGFVFSKSASQTKEREYGLIVRGSDDRVRFQYTYADSQKINRSDNINWTGIDLADGAWHHLTLTVSSELKATLFVDGVDKGEKSMDGSMVKIPDAILWLGKRQDGINPFKGLIEEVRIWGDVRTVQQIQANMLGRLDPDSSGLIGYWPMDDSQGLTATDRSSSLNHGRLGSAEQTAVPKWKQASPIQFEGTTFDGKGDHIEIPSSESLDLTSDITLSGWIQPNQFLGLQGIVSKRMNAHNCQYALSLDGEMLRFDINHDGRQYTLSGGRLDEGWHHVAVTIKTVTTTRKRFDGKYTERIVEPVKKPDGSQYDENAQAKTIRQRVMVEETVTRPKIKLFVDGMLVGKGQAKLAPKQSEALVQIGVLGGKLKKHFFHGRINSVVIRNKALTQSDLQRDMHADFDTTPIGHVVGYWQLKLDAGETVEDLSSHNNDGQLKYQRRFRQLSGPVPKDGFVPKPVQGQTPERKALRLTGNNYAHKYFDGIKDDDPRTIEAWIKLDKAKFPEKSPQTIIFWGDDDDDGEVWAVQITKRREVEAVLRLDVNGGFIEGETNLADDYWHHVTVSFDGENVTDAKLYVDGVLQTVTNQAPQVVDTNNETCYVGIMDDKHPFYGWITEIRIWDVALEQQQIRVRKNRFLVGNEEDLVRYWPCLEGNGAQIADYSKNNNDALEFEEPEWVSGADSGLTLNSPLTCLLFNGETDYALIPAMSPVFHKAKNLTFETWLRVDAFTENGTIFSSGGFNQIGDAYLQITEEGLTFGVYPSLTWKSVWGGENPLLELQKWYHLAIVFRPTRQGLDEASSVEAYLSAYKLISETDSDLGFALNAILLKGEPTTNFIPPIESASFQAKPQMLESPTPVENGGFGTAVAINDEWAIVTAHKEGKAYFYKLNQASNSWESGKVVRGFNVTELNFLSEFGSAIASNHESALIGTQGADIVAATGGIAHLVDFSASGELSPAIKPYDIDLGEITELLGHFGSSVALNSKYALVGAPDLGLNLAERGVIRNGLVYVITIDNLETTVEGSSWGKRDDDGLFYSRVPLMPEEYKEGSEFGHAVALSDKWAIASAPKAPVGDHSSAGKVYIYDCNKISHSHVAKLESPEPESSIGFGYSVAITDTWALVGTRDKKAYLYQYDTQNNAWITTYQYRLSGPDGFGYNVALNDEWAMVASTTNGAYLYPFNTLNSQWEIDYPIILRDPQNGSITDIGLSNNFAIIGVPQANITDTNDNPVDNAGRATIFPLPKQNLQVFQAENPQASAQFGDALAIRQNWAVIGSSYENVDGKSEAGRVYLYGFDEIHAKWHRTNPVTIQAPMPQAYAQFGHSVAITDHWLLVGSHHETINDKGGRGRAYLYQYNQAEGSWEEMPKTILEEPEEKGGYFGGTVALTEKWALVGAHHFKSVGENSGRVFLFLYDKSTQTWAQAPEKTFDPTGSGWGNGNGLRNVYFGRALSISDDWFIVGAPGQDFDKGRAYLYRFDQATSTWDTTPTTLDFPNDSIANQFGTSVAITKEWALVGASHEDIETHENAGRAYLYCFNRVNLEWESENPTVLEAPTPQENANFGISVALVEGWALVGAYHEDMDGSSNVGRGYLYRYDEITGQWDTTPAEEIELVNLSAGSEFGFKVALNNAVALIGAPKADIGTVNGAGIVLSTDLPRPMLLGKADLDTAGSSHFHGRLAETRFWHGARHPLYLNGYRQQRLFGSEANLAAYWPLGEYGTQSVRDASGFGKDGHLFGPSWQPMDDPLIPEDTSQTPGKPPVRLLPPIHIEIPPLDNQSHLAEKEAYYAQVDGSASTESSSGSSPLPLLPLTVTSLSPTANVPKVAPPIPPKPIDDNSSTPTVVTAEPVTAANALLASLKEATKNNKLTLSSANMNTWMTGFDNYGTDFGSFVISTPTIAWIYEVDSGDLTDPYASVSSVQEAVAGKPIGISIKGKMDLEAFMGLSGIEVVLDLTQSTEEAGSEAETSTTVWTYRLHLDMGDAEYNLNSLPLLKELNIPGFNGLMVKKPDWSDLAEGEEEDELSPTDQGQYDTLTGTGEGSIAEKDGQVKAKIIEIRDLNDERDQPNYEIELATLEEELAELQDELIGLNSKKLFGIILANGDDDPNDSSCTRAVAGFNAFGAFNCANMIDGNLIKDFIHGVCGVEEVQYYVMRNKAGDYVVELTTSASLSIGEGENKKPSGLFAPINVLFGAESMDVTFAITNMSAEESPAEASSSEAEEEADSNRNSNEGSNEAARSVALSVEASSLLELDDSNHDLISWFSEQIGTERMLVTVSGVKQGESLDLTFEAVADAQIDENSNPVLKLIKEVFGLTLLHFELEAHRPAGSTASDSDTGMTENDLDLSLSAAATLDLSSSTQSLVVFLRNFVGIQDLKMDLLVGIAKEGGADPAFDAVATTKVNPSKSSNPFFGLLHDFLKVDTVTVVVSLSQSAIALSISLDVNHVLVKDEEVEVLKILNAAVAVSIQRASLDMAISFSMTFAVTMPKEEATGERDVLTLAGGIGVSGLGTPTVSLLGELSMIGDWNTPFGAQGVLISDVKALIGISQVSPYLNEVGLAGRLRMGELGFETAIYFNRSEPQKSGVVAIGHNINIANIVTSFAGPESISADLEDALKTIITINQIDFRMVPPGGFSVGDITYGPEHEGFTGLADLSIFGWDIYGYIRIDYGNGVEVHGALEGFNFAGGLIALGRPPVSELTLDEDDPFLPGEKLSSALPAAMSEYDKGGPILYAKLSPDAQPACYLLAEVTTLGLTRTVALAFIGDEIRFYLEGSILDLFEASVLCIAKTDFSSITVVATLEQDFFDKIIEAATDLIAKATGPAIQNLKDEQEKVRKLDDEIEERRKEIEEERQAVKDAFEDAKAEVDKAQKEVDGIQEEIDDLNDHWDSLPDVDWPWDESKAREWTWIGPALGGLHLAKITAFGALMIAKEVLEAGDFVIENLPEEMDPILGPLLASRIVALEGLGLAEDGVAGLGELGQTVLEAVGDAKVFDLTMARFEASFSMDSADSKAKQSYNKDVNSADFLNDIDASVSMTLALTFLSKEYNPTFPINLRDLTNGAAFLLEKIADEAGISISIG